MRGNSGGRTLGEDRTFGVYTFERSILGGTRFERRTRWGEHVVGGGHFGENNFERETRGRTLVGESVERREH